MSTHFVRINLWTRMCAVGGDLHPLLMMGSEEPLFGVWGGGGGIIDAIPKARIHTNVKCQPNPYPITRHRPCTAVSGYSEEVQYCIIATGVRFSTCSNSIVECKKWLDEAEWMPCIHWLVVVIHIPFYLLTLVFFPHVVRFLIKSTLFCWQLRCFGAEVEVSV